MRSSFLTSTLDLVEGSASHSGQFNPVYTLPGEESTACLDMVHQPGIEHQSSRPWTVTLLTKLSGWQQHQQDTLAYN